MAEASGSAAIRVTAVDAVKATVRQAAARSENWEGFIGIRLTACGLPCFLAKSNLQNDDRIHTYPACRRCDAVHRGVPDGCVGALRGLFAQPGRDCVVGIALALRAALHHGKTGCPQTGPHGRFPTLTSMKCIRARLGFVAVLLAALPFFLPRRPRVARRILIRADRGHVFGLINDLRNWPRWTAWNSRREVEYHYEGPPAGAGATQEMRSAAHTDALHITQSHEPERIAFSLMRDDCWLLEGAISLDEIAPHHTRVLWVARWHGAVMPWARYVDLARMLALSREFSVALENLRHLAETTSPIPEIAS